MIIQSYAMTFNEAEWIERYAKSVTRLCNKCTIFDGGSTDGTVEKAKDLGLEVIDFPQPWDVLDYNNPKFRHGWRRNECISQLTGDWIFNLDADEELVTDYPGILRDCIMGAGNGVAFKFIRYNLWCAEDLYRKDWMEWYPWLWRNGAGIYYADKNSPHEPLVDHNGTNLLVDAIPVDERHAKILHYHYVRGWKAERHLHCTAEGIRKDAERLRNGAEPNVACLPWLK